ncbi:MAG: hypothetical protein DRH50_09275, partial [Deltaproteobacteria bacterium]
MNKNRIIKALFVLAYIWILLFMAGCAAKSRDAGIVIEPAEKEGLLRQRIQEMWHAQVNGDRATMYEYYDPFFRARVKKGLFAGKEIPIQYYNAVIDSMEIKGNVATVRVSMEYEVKGLPGRLAPIDVPRRATIDHETW